LPGNFTQLSNQTLSTPVVPQVVQQDDSNEFEVIDVSENL